MSLSYMHFTHACKYNVERVVYMYMWFDYAFDSALYIDVDGHECMQTRTVDMDSNLPTLQRSILAPRMPRTQLVVSEILTGQ